MVYLTLIFVASLALAWGQDEIPPVIAQTPADSALDSAAAHEEQDPGDEDEEDWSEEGLAGLDFLLPVDGDVFYTPDISILVNIQGFSPSGMVLVLDGYNYDRPLGLEAGLLKTRIEDLHQGVHELELLLLADGNRILARGRIRFFIRLPEPKKEIHTGPVRQFGRVAARFDVKGAEARSRVRNQKKLNLEEGEITAGKSEEPLSRQIEGAVEAAYNLKVYDWEAHTKVLLRTEENEFRQPAHRFSARVKYGPYGYLKAGDVYPAFNELLLNGTRVRGGEVGLSVVTDDISWASLKVARGESRREIPAYVAVYDTGNGDRTDTVSGTFGQTLTAVRLGFGGGGVFDLGITGMMAEDRIGSKSNLELTDSLHGIRPLQNAGTGVDLRIGLWDGKVQLFSDYALTLLTRDKSLGASDGGDIDLSFDPKSFDDYFQINPSTQGLQYLIENSQSNSDIPGFINANAAWDAGINMSIPLNGVTTESEIRYDHLGLLYHTEGNPFLGSDPGDGIRFLQKLLLLENRLALGLEASRFSQDLGLSRQQERSYKAEIRWTPLSTQPSGWVSIGSTERAPEGRYPYQYHSGFLTFNAGAYQQFLFPIGRLHASALYGFTQSEFDLTATSIIEPTDVDDLLDFPTARTHIANVSLQLRPRAIDFMPRISYTFTNNGVQEPTHNVAMGLQQLWLNGRIKADCGLQVGQYPESLTRNDLLLGETFAMDLRFTPTQSARFTEKWIQYGERRNISVGGFYELYF